MKAAMIGRMYLLMLVVFAAAMAHQEGQAKLVVDDDGGAWADYDNIQDALDNASVNETIEVYEGVYTENIEITVSRVMLMGNGSDVVTINGGGSLTVDVKATDVVISGFNITANSSAPGAYAIQDSGYDGLNVSSCDVHHSLKGIYTLNADGIIIRDCRVHNNSQEGILLFQGLRGRIEGCTISDNYGYGTMWDRMSTSTLLNTKYYNDGHNIYGSYDYHANSHVISNCKVNGHPLYYGKNLTSGTISGSYGQVILGNCTNVSVSTGVIQGADAAIVLLKCSFVTVSNCILVDGYNLLQVTASDNCTIRRSEVRRSDNWGVIVTNSVSTRIENSLVRDNVRYGIRIHTYSRYTTVRSVTVYNNSLEGIIVYMADNTVIEDCTVYSTTYGVGIWQDSDTTVVRNCTIGPTSGDGIYIYKSRRITVWNCSINDTSSGNGVHVYWNADNITVGNCSIHNNSDDGILLNIGIDEVTISGNDITDNNDHGIAVSTDCTNVNITNNSIHGNVNPGVYFTDSTNSSVTYNDIYDNGGYGIQLSTLTADITVHHNNLKGNGGTSSQGNDSEAWNSWDDGAEGNWWSDYNGTDGNGDGIGDSPYSIDGAGGSDDRYPLMNVTQTGSPKPVPEIGTILLSMTAFALLVAVLRRRR